MGDQVLLSAGQHNIQKCIDLALQHDLGIEVMAFAFPNVLDGDWRSTLDAYKAMLSPIQGMLAMHGPFMDMAPGSPDHRINRVCVQRYQHAINIAAELEVHHIVFHANFISAIHNIEYRTGWHERNVVFWSEMAEYAHARGVTLAMENMWEFDPTILQDILKEVDHPNLRACLDVGHAHLFSDAEFPFSKWVEAIMPWLIHLHINNNNGKIDVHQGLHNGVLDYHVVLEPFRAMPNPPSITLEMDHVEDMAASLDYMRIKNNELAS